MRGEDEEVCPKVFFLKKSQDAITRVGSKACPCVESWEQINCGLDVTTTFHLTWLQELTEFLLCTQKAGAVIILILGVGACKSGVGEGLSLVKVLREFLRPQGKKTKSWEQIKGTDGNIYRNISHVAPTKKSELLWAKYWFKEASDWEQSSGFCFFHVMEIKHLYFFF